MQKNTISVTVKENESIDRALKRFKKKLDQIGLLKRIRKQNFYIKPSIHRRNTKLQADTQTKNDGYRRVIVCL